MENTNNNEIKLNISGHTKMYHNGELFFDKPNTITGETKRYLTEAFYVSNATSKLVGPGHTGGNALVSGASNEHLNVNRAGTNATDITSTSITGKAGILISKNSATSGASGNIINAMNTVVEILNTSPIGRRIRFIGTFVKTGSSTVYDGAAIAFGIKPPTSGPDASAQPKAAGDSATYSSYHLVYGFYQGIIDTESTLTDFAIQRTTRPIAYQSGFNRTLNDGDTLTIDWTITIN
jgi:hypothetical protein